MQSRLLSQLVLSQLVLLQLDGVACRVGEPDLHSVLSLHPAYVLDAACFELSDGTVEIVDGYAEMIAGRVDRGCRWRCTDQVQFLPADHEPVAGNARDIRPVLIPEAEHTAV